MTDLCATVRRLQRLTRGGIHREAVIVRGDGDPARGDILHGLVDSPVPEAQLVGPKSEGPAQHLVPEADSEHRSSCIQGRAHKAHGMVSDRRIARTIGEEHSVATSVEHLLGTHVTGQDMDGDAPLRHEFRSHRLDAEVHRGDDESLSTLG